MNISWYLLSKCCWTCLVNLTTIRGEIISQSLLPLYALVLDAWVSSNAHSSVFCVCLGSSSAEPHCKEWIHTQTRQQPLRVQWELGASTAADHRWRYDSWRKALGHLEILHGGSARCCEEVRLILMWIWCWKEMVTLRGYVQTFIWNLTCRTPVFSTQGETMQRLLRDSRRPEGRARGRTQKIVQETCFEIPSRQEPRSGCYRGIQRYKLRFNAWLEAYQTRFCFVKLKHDLNFNISFSWKLSGMRMPSWVTRTKDSSTTSVKKRGDILRVTALATGTSSPIFPLRTSSICSSEEATRQVSHHFVFSCQGIQ